MEREQILAVVQTLIRNNLEDDEIVLTEDLKSTDIRGWDSMANLNIISKIEKHFQIRLTVGEIVVIQNIGDLVTIIKNKIDAKKN